MSRSLAQLTRSTHASQRLPRAWGPFPAPLYLPVEPRYLRPSSQRRLIAPRQPLPVFASRLFASRRSPPPAVSFALVSWPRLIRPRQPIILVSLFPLANTHDPPLHSRPSAQRQPPIPTCAQRQTTAHIRPPLSSTAATRRYTAYQQFPRDDIPRRDCLDPRSAAAALPQRRWCALYNAPRLMIGMSQPACLS